MLRRQKSTSRLFHEFFSSSRCLRASKVRNAARQAKAATISSSRPRTSKAAPTSLRARKVCRMLVVSLLGALPLRTARADLRSCDC